MYVNKVPSDVLAKRVYAWEEREVGTGEGDYILTKDEIRELVAETSRYLGIEVPSIRFAVSKAPCYADLRNWNLAIMDWGRTKRTVLHEMAHFATLNAVLRGEDGHGPSFVAAAINLYVSFLGLDRMRLIKTALSSHIRVGPAAMPKVQPQKGFMNIDF